ncbi:MAG: serine/threonine protein kinase [Oscillospiraceae bacterium]|nr:serine/threonine protein kinase [Oscillospiraceae bacterium]
MQYTKIKLLSSSAQGEVWLVELFDSRRAVSKRYPYSDSLYDMFTRLKAIKCDSLPDIYHAEHIGNEIEIVEEYVHGNTLSDIMAYGRKFTSNEVRSIGLYLCDTLEKLHNSGLIHRDIKPSNIMLTDAGTIKLIDFNAARSYDGNQDKDTRLLGTEGYAAPEQYGFSETDYRADIYSVGVTLKELCRGEVGSLRRAINGCTEFDPKKRYKTVKALRKDISHPYRREITGCVVSALLITAIVWLFSCADVPKALSEITGKAVYDVDMISPVTVEYMLNDTGNEYFSDGEGEVEFSYARPLDNYYGILYDHPDAQFVDFTMPDTALLFRVSKNSNVVVDDLKIVFEMHGILLHGHGYSSENVELTDHVNGIGMYAGAVWACDTALSEEQFVLDFKNAAVFGDDPHISVTISADGFKNKSFDIAVKKSDSYIYPFSSPEHFEYIFDGEPLIGERLLMLTTGMGDDYILEEYNGYKLIGYDNINIKFIVNDDDIIVGLIGTEGIWLSGMSQIGMPFDELEQGLASLVWTDKTVMIDDKELKVAIADIGGIDYRIYFHNDISLFAEL